MKTANGAFVALFACVAAVGCGSGKTGNQPPSPSVDGGTDAASPPMGDGGTPAPDGAAPSDGGTTTDAGGPITTHPTNLLNNGGFEYGTMCYGQYEWSAANPANVGTGYQFSLSTADVHGGAYAAQIACVNGSSDCGYPGKAALQLSPTFHTPHNQAYSVTVYTKCAAGDNAFFYTPNVASGSFTSPFVCNGSWAENQFQFTSSATDDYVYYALYYAGKASLLVDDVVITYGDGTVPAQTIKHPGTRAASVSNGTFTVDGKPFLPLGFYGIPAESIPAAQQMGVNAVAWGDPGCFNTDAPVYADTAYEAGIGLIPESSTTARAGVAQVFPGVLGEFGRHLADIAWYLDDEPDMTAVVYEPITPAILTAEYQALHGTSSMPVAAMLQHAHYDPPAVDQPYQGAMDVYLSEPYGPSFGGITQSMTVFDTMTKRPVWFAEDDGPGAAGIVPKAYFSFISGGTGLLFFTWGGFTTDSTLAAAGQAITEIGSLTDAIVGPDVTSQVTGPAGIAFIARTAGGKTYILAVNAGSAAVTGTFTYAPLTAGQSVTVQFESRTIPASAGSFSDTFTPVSRHVYVVQ
jgi:hypothetical protein